MATINTVPQQNVTTYPAPVVVTSQPEAHPASAYKKAFLGVGITQVVIGVLCLILGGISLIPSVTGSIYYVGSGIWGGLWFTVTGSVGIASGINTNTCNVVAGLILTIFSALVAFGVLVAEAVTAGLARTCIRITFSSLSLCPGEAFEGIHATLAALAFVEFIVTIIHSAYCCSGTCCRSRREVSTLATTMTITTAAHQQPMYTGQIPGQSYGQQLQYYPQPTQGYSNYGMNQPQQPLPNYEAVLQPQPQPQPTSNTQYATNIEKQTF